MPTTETNNQGTPIPRDNQERAAGWRHDQPISVIRNDFEALNFARELTLRAWLEGFGRSLPVISGDERLMQEHFNTANARFGFSRGKNAPVSSYNNLLRRLEKSPGRPDTIKSTLKGRDSNIFTVQLEGLLNMKMRDIKQYYHTGYINFLVFVNAVMIAIEEASANTALPPQDPTRS